MSVSIQDAAKEMQQRIKSEDIKNRLDFAGTIWEREEPFDYLFKTEGPIGYQTIDKDGNLPKSTFYTCRHVKPKNIGFNVDISGWPTDLNTYQLDMISKYYGQQLAFNEAKVVIAGLSTFSEDTLTVKTANISLDDIKNAIKKLTEKNSYADSIILSNTEYALLKEKGILTELMPSIPQPIIIKNNKAIIAGLCAYSFPMTDCSAILFQKGSIILTRSPLKIRMDPPESPLRLIIEQWCSSAPSDGREVIKIEK